MRLIVSAATLVVAFGFAFWQNHALLNVLNRPLANATSGALEHSRGPLAESAQTQQAVRVALNRQRVAPYGSAVATPKAVWTEKR